MLAGFRYHRRLGDRSPIAAERTIVNVAEALAATPVSAVDLSRYVSVPIDTSVEDTIAALCAAGRSCACVVDGQELVGIFTQRDVLNRVIGRRSVWDVPISEEMTRRVKTIRPAASVSDGLSIMTDWWVRSVPVVEDGARLVGNLSYYTVMDIIARMITERTGDDSTKSEVRHSLTLIDFTGLHTSPPVTVHLDDTADVAAHHMRARAIGSVLVVDDREHLAGVVSEFDLMMKIGCDTAELDAIAVKDIMTPEPVALAARSSVADAIRWMSDLGFSHVPLLGESGRPVAVASFRDIAAYVEASFAALG